MAEDPSNKAASDQEKEARTVAAGTRMIAVVEHRIDSRDLFITTREIIINHGSEAYRLRLTAQNKLILTK
jgi:hemin uptake protein HemP